MSLPRRAPWRPHRRALLESLGLLGLAPGVGWLAAACAARPREAAGEEQRADLVVLGGGLGGVAAALAATDLGLRVLLVEPTPWIGGQLTSQGVPPDENPRIERDGANASYLELRRRVRTRYQEHRALSDAARDDPRLNPGGGFVSRLCAEPREWLAACESLLAPAVAAGRLTVLLGARARSAAVEGDRVRALECVRADGTALWAEAPWFVDASEEGDLLPLAGVEHRTGAEARAETGEPHAREQADPLAQQAITWCLALEHRPGEDHRGDPPPGWERWRAFAPDLDPPWTGPLYSLVASHPITLEPRTYAFEPPGRGADGTWEAPRRGGAPDLFAYRQLVDPRRVLDRDAPATLVNWPQNDAWAEPLHGPGVDAARRERGLRAAREISRGLVHWLRTEAPRADGGRGWPGLAPARWAFGTEDGLALAPYVRESRRLVARATITERDLSPAVRAEAQGLTLDARGRHPDLEATPFADSVGIGHYRIDLHPTTAGHNYLDVDALPFRVPLGALVPVRVRNLLAGGKGLGATHVANGATRLHPVEWGVGEAAGTLVAVCASRGWEPRGVHGIAARVEVLQGLLRARGARLSW